MTVLDEVLQTRTDSSSYADRDRARICRPNPRIPFVARRAEGAYIYESEGRKVFDLTSGWNVANTGWNHPTVIKAVADQLGAGLSYAPPWCTHVGRVEYAERLCAVVGEAYRVYGLTSGTEAVEAALKIARRATGRHTVVGFQQAFHGGTLGSMLAGGVSALHGVDLAMTNEHRHLPIMYELSDPEEYCRKVVEIITASPAPAAVLLEPVFTNPGVLHADKEFYQAVQAAARSVGALLIVDEVGTGFGRTGKMFGYQHWDLEPDLIAVSKAMGSGVIPIAGVLVRQELAAVVSGPGYSSTFAWTPLGCAAADGTLTVLKSENLCERARDLGNFGKEYLTRHLDLPTVKAIRGLGLEMSIELALPDQPLVPLTAMRALTARLLYRGLFAEPSSFISSLLVMPPLILSDSQWSDALAILVEEISNWTEIHAP